MPSDLQQPTNGDAIGAPLILLNLLEGNADALAQALLTHASVEPKLPDTLAQH